LTDGERRVVRIFAGIVVGAAHLIGGLHGTVRVAPLKSGESPSGAARAIGRAPEELR